MSQNNPSPEKSQKSSLRESLLLMIKGFLMGSADIVPGVSGGTMALIVGIYTRLIDAIKSFDFRFFKRLVTLKIKAAFRDVDWRFMVFLLAGMACAVLFFTKVVPLQVYMFTDPELIFGLFFGLIVGSIVILVKAIENVSWIHGLMILVGTAIGFWVVTLVPTNTPESALFIFISGSIAICAMILPGISGSYILLILQKYDFILSQIGKLGTPETTAAVVTLLPFAIGAAFGLAVFSRMLSWLLHHYEAKTLAILIGFLIGSLYVIWPYQNRTYKEIITKKQIVTYNSEKAEQLRENPPDEKRPRYQRLGEVVNPDASGDNKKVELLTAKRKLIKTDPYIPYLTVSGPKTEHFSSGLWGMLAGLLMVLLLDYVRPKG